MSNDILPTFELNSLQPKGHKTKGKKFLPQAFWSLGSMRDLISSFHSWISIVLSTKIAFGTRIETFANDGISFLHSSIHQYLHNSGTNFQISFPYRFCTVTLFIRDHINPGHTFNTSLYMLSLSSVRCLEHSTHKQIGSSNSSNAVQSMFLNFLCLLISWTKCWQNVITYGNTLFPDSHFPIKNWCCFLWQFKHLIYSSSPLTKTSGTDI